MNYETNIGLRYLRSKKKGAFVSFTTWISVIGIAIGVMALIIVIAVMTGFQDEIRERILGINPHVIVHGFEGELRDPERLVNEIASVNGVKEVMPFLAFQGMVQSGRQMTGVAVKAYRPENVAFMKRILKEGPLESLGRKGNLFVGRELAKRMGLVPGDAFTLMVPFGGFSPMGATPETVMVRVGGVFETGMFEVDNTLLIMSLSDVQSMMGIGATGIEVKLQDPYQADAARKEIIKRLGSGYMARTWIEMNRNLFSALKLEKIALFIILALIILVASFNIITSLIMTVMEKKKDIAILRAMGAKWQSIMKIFMTEGITIGVVGALFGFLFGYLACEVQRRFEVIKLPGDVYNMTALPVKISLVDMLLVVSVTMAICIVSTLYPSYKAAKIDPVETLRYE